MQIKKNPKADLERKRVIFLEIGFIAALAVCFAAFGMTSGEYQSETLGPVSLNGYIDPEMLVVDLPEKKENQEQPEPEIIAEELTIVDDNVETEVFNPDLEAGENIATNIRIVQPAGLDPEPEITDPVPFVLVEEKPVFPGGEVAMFKFLNNNIRYPEKARELSLSGKVFVQFVISPQGKVTQVQLARGVDELLDNEAIRVVKQMPDWTPGLQRKIPVSVTMIIPINFILE